VAKWFFDVVPITLLAGITVVASWGVVELGQWLGLRRKKKGGESETPVGASVGATLGLLAFTLGFSFSMAATRFDSRKQAVVDEANAIGTTYLRTSLLPEPAASKARQLLREYVDVRVEAAARPEGYLNAITRSEQLQNALWIDAAALGVQVANPATTGLFIQALNDMIDMQGTRLAAVRNRIPPPIWVFLWFTAGVGMLSMGYQAGLSGSPRNIAMIALVLAFSGVITLIADLDRPQHGFLRVSQEAMFDLQRSMRP